MVFSLVLSGKMVVTDMSWVLFSVTMPGHRFVKVGFIDVVAISTGWTGTSSGPEVVTAGSAGVAEKVFSGTAAIEGVVSATLFPFGIATVEPSANATQP